MILPILRKRETNRSYKHPSFHSGEMDAEEPFETGNLILGNRESRHGFGQLSGSMCVMFGAKWLFGNGSMGVGTSIASLYSHSADAKRSVYSLTHPYGFQLVCGLGTPYGRVPTRNLFIFFFSFVWNRNNNNCSFRGRDFWNSINSKVICRVFVVRKKKKKKWFREMDKTINDFNVILIVSIAWVSTRGNHFVPILYLARFDTLRVEMRPRERETEEKQKWHNSSIGCFGHCNKWIKLPSQLNAWK